AGSGSPAFPGAVVAQTNHASSAAAAVRARSLPAAEAMARRPLPLTATRSTPCEPRERRRVCRRRAQRLRAELHVVGAAERRLGEIHLEDLFELLAVPDEAAQELLVLGTELVPVGQQRRGDVDAFAVPALRDHVDLLAGDLRVGLPRRLRVAQIEVARGSVHERVDPQPLAVT